MVFFCPPFVPFNEGPVKSTDEVHVLGKIQSGSLGMFLHPYRYIGCNIVSTCSQYGKKKQVRSDSGSAQYA